MSRSPIDTGTTGSSSSADNVNNFSLKTVNNFNDIYNSYSDTRLDEDSMMFHAAGYFQDTNYDYWLDSDPVAGGQYLISTYGSTENSVSITLPTIIDTYSTLTEQTQNGNYIRQGERIKFMVVDDSLNNIPISLVIDSNSKMVGNSNPIISCSAGIIELIVEAEGWNYYIKPFNPNANRNGVYKYGALTNNSQNEIKLYDTNVFNVFKFNLLIKTYSNLYGEYTNYMSGDFCVMLDGNDNLLYDDYNDLLSSDIFDISLRYYDGSVYINIIPNDSNTIPYYTLKGTNYISLKKTKKLKVQSTLNITWSNQSS